MLKSIITSPEAAICNNSHIKRDYSTVLTNLEALDREINSQIKKYEDRQAQSKNVATQIRSR